MCRVSVNMLLYLTKQKKYFLLFYRYHCGYVDMDRWFLFILMLEYGDPYICDVIFIWIVCMGKLDGVLLMLWKYSDRKSITSIVLNISLFLDEKKIKFIVCTYIANRPIIKVTKIIISSPISVSCIDYIFIATA